MEIILLLKMLFQEYPLSNNSVLQAEGYHRFLFKKNYIALYLIDDEKKVVSIMRIFYAKRRARHHAVQV